MSSPATLPANFKGFDAPTPPVSPQPVGNQGDSAPATLPPDFKAWDSNPPDKLPADFTGFDAPTQQSVGHVSSWQPTFWEQLQRAVPAIGAIASGDVFKQPMESQDTSQ